MLIIDNIAYFDINNTYIGIILCKVVEIPKNFCVEEYSNIII